MKKLFLMAAVAAMTLASCAKTDGPANDDKGNIVIKLNGVNTRSVDVPEDGENDKITLDNGWVFVFSNAGTLMHGEELIVDPAATNSATSASATVGQVLMEGTEPLKVTGSEKVYIVGNITDDDMTAFDAMDNTTTDDEVLEHVYSGTLLSLQIEGGFNFIPVANATGEPAAIASTTVDFNGANELANYVATINLVPLMSRVELMAVQADDEVDAVGLISAFEIGGVYIDSYYPNFTYGGTLTGVNDLTLTPQALADAPWYGGETVEQKRLLDFTANELYIGSGSEGGPWAAGNTIPYTATAGNDNVWAYNVPSKGVARLIVKLDSVTYTKADPDEADGVSTDPADVVTVTNQFLTVGSYTFTLPNNSTSTLVNMERGSLYRIGVAGDNEFEFGPGDLDPFPNPTEGTLTVKVTVDDWEVVTPDAELM